MKIPDPTSSDLPLHDIQLPEPISWWPLAWGWWAVLAALIVVMVLVIWFFYTRQKKSVLMPEIQEPIRTVMRREVIAIEHTFKKNKDSAWLAQQLAQVLRKTVLLESSIEKKQILAGLTGSDWLSAMDEHFNLPPKQSFLSKHGIALLEAPYQKEKPYDEAALITFINWVLNHEPKTASSSEDGTC